MEYSYLCVQVMRTILDHCYFSSICPLIEIELITTVVVFMFGQRMFIRILETVPCRKGDLVLVCRDYWIGRGAQSWREWHFAEIISQAIADIFTYFF